MGSLYDHLLVPTDGSAGTTAVIQHANELARVHDATVHALYVLETGGFTDLPMETAGEQFRDMFREEGETALEEVQRLTDDAVTVQGSVLEGTPSEEIGDYARDQDVDLIVMGTHGRGGLDRLLLGSVAERVVRTATVPVLTINVADELEG
jgi:nucleotide-binding universal stress UspA family protein